MNIIFRTLLAFYAFCLTVISLIMMIITLNKGMFVTATDFLAENVLANKASVILLFIIELIFFGLSLMFLLSGVRSERNRKSISKFNKIGEVKISLNTIENIALASSRRNNGVRESKAYVKRAGENVSVHIKTVVMPDINIPALLEDVQRRVKKSIEDTSGILVDDVKVSVENIYAGYRSRVE
ncbi:alkaline shock response membrane anchor protein AmaP [Herbivorax sp. ANBcel31]|uniref:alkaline shock response membrane anchor protein AmaP n=1 Tax=Herbivorax sp. ANBcel31 TaxID=3069754 RepID=UPI0027AE6ED5|nr:alkaline shock response membrane anchor protein AmaP [Herbivorax sp. ANBcel31]MDQ2085308.1 alkaline shock response membrane anchor protein AmaP [Herbivorax sp. ANBcel31]